MFYSILIGNLFLLSIVHVNGQACVYSSDPLVRCTTQGLVRGIRSDFLINTTTSTESKSVYAFLGIPYAEPPEGEKRFRKPVPKRPWSRTMIYNVTALQNSCYQMVIEWFNTTGERMWIPFTPLSEDCLYLNIWTPITAKQPQKPLAVMIWIYGGGFSSGSSSLDVYDGSILASTQNVIVASMEYRMETLGFLYLGTPDAPGNQGLYDQSLAIEWIYKNIRNFGGDPNRITLFGESAGAVSVGLHLLSPRSRPYFNNAILESAGPSAKWAVVSANIAKYRSERFLNEFTHQITQRLETGPDDPEYPYIPRECQKRMTTMQEKFLCVKNYPIISLNHFRTSWGIESSKGGPVGYNFVAAVDGDFIPYDPELMLKGGDFKKCPLLLGVNRDEGSYFIVYLAQGNMSIETWPYVDQKTFRHAIEQYFPYIPAYPTERPPMILESILQTYTRWHDHNNTIQNAVQLNLAVGDYHFICPTVYLANSYARESLPIYFYNFVIRSTVSPWHEWMGVLHADEIMFVFGEPLNTTDNLNYTYEEIAISQKIMAYWTNFAKYSNPNQRHDSQWANEWRQYKLPAREHIILNHNLTQNLYPDHGSAVRAEYCAFWLEYIPKLATMTANISEEETRWKQEFRQYQERTQQWDHYYMKYLELLEKNSDKLLNCMG